MQACLDALRAASTAQATAVGELTGAASAIATSQAALAAQSQALTARLAAAAKAATPNGASTGAGAVTNAKLIVDRAAVTSAEAALTKAQHFLDAATLTAPIGGVVGTVPFSVGDTATTATGLVIVGPGASKVTVQVPQANLATVSLGQVGHITVSGSPIVDGVVTAIALLPTASASTSAAAGSSSPTYAVDLLVAGFPEQVGSGGKATVALVTKRVENSLTVPASAVTMLSTGTGVAQRVRGAVVTTVTVQIGAVGGSTIEVVGGLSAGDIVVIGDPTQPLPTNGNIPGLGGGLGGIGGVGGGNARVPAGPAGPVSPAGR